MKDVIQKCRFKDTGIILNAPIDIETEFKQQGFKSTLNKEGESENVLIFINNMKEYKEFLHSQLKKIKADSILWFAYPKGTSKIKTDINRDTIREVGEEYGITTVAAISINDTWSALRFRPIDRVGK